ncbi:MAG: Nucleoid occlusion protein [Bacteroidetes bacterium ADurb.BinA104]|nr:MAG: Nucleoid occlusion protein [Bacteroidetes bacterium ADurb.BinA104]
MAKKTTEMNVQNVKIADLDLEKNFGRTARWSQDEVKQLADNIKLVGLAHPIVVYANHKTGKYDVISGVGRSLAFKLLKRTEIPAQILETATAASKYELGLSANVFAKQVTRSEIVELIHKLRNVESKPMDQIAKVIGIGESTAKLYDQVGNALKVTVGEAAAQIILDSPIDMRTLREIARNKLVQEAIKASPQVDEAVEIAKAAKKAPEVNARKTGKKGASAKNDPVAKSIKGAVNKAKGEEPKADSPTAKAKRYDTLVTKVKAAWVQAKKTNTTNKATDASHAREVAFNQVLIWAGVHKES